MKTARVKIMPLSECGIDVTIDKVVDGEETQEVKHVALGDSIEVDLNLENGDWAHIEPAAEDADGADSRG